MPFEDDLGTAIRRTGDTFQPAETANLVDGGLTRGRRRLARRRLTAVAGSVMALAVVGVTGAYLTGGTGPGGTESGGTGPQSAERTATSVAAPPPPGQGDITGERMVSTLKGLLPKGEIDRENGRGADAGPEGARAPYASVVFDDGKGAAAISLSLGTVDPAGRTAQESVTCPSKALVQYDACDEETLPDGSRYMLFQGYEYPDRRVDTKLWRATLVTASGVRVEAGQWNAAREKDAPVSRPNPPLSPARMKTLVTDRAWAEMGAALDRPRKEQLRPGTTSGIAVDDVLESLLPQGMKTVEKQGDPGYGFVVVDDGRGRSFVQVNVQNNMQDLASHWTGDVTTAPDGTEVMVQKENDPDQKGGAGAVGWTVDALSPDGFRVMISAFNTPGQGQDASRAEPALTIEQMKTVVLDEKWRTAAQ